MNTDRMLHAVMTAQLDNYERGELLSHLGVPEDRWPEDVRRAGEKVKVWLDYTVTLQLQAPGKVLVEVTRDEYQKREFHKAMAREQYLGNIVDGLDRDYLSYDEMEVLDVTLDDVEDA